MLPNVQLRISSPWHPFPAAGIAHHHLVFIFFDFPNPVVSFGIVFIDVDLDINLRIAFVSKSGDAATLNLTARKLPPNDELFVNGSPSAVIDSNPTELPA